ncbi:hypothetical protein QQG55_6385 [Brugia pahangi]
MSNDGPTDIQSGINNSTTYRDLSLDCGTTEKLSKLTVTRNNSPLKSFGEKKTRERNMKIARGHQMFKNIESALSDGSAKRKSLEQGKKEKQSINELQLGEMMLRSAFDGKETRKPLDSSMITADELISLFDLAVSDCCSMHDKFSKISLLIIQQTYNTFFLYLRKCLMVLLFMMK